jgi:hypothetical protein
MTGWEALAESYLHRCSSYAKKNKNHEKKCIGPIGGNIS